MIPAWLISFLVQLLKPVLLEIMASVEFQITMASINKKRAASKEAFEALDKAETEDEIEKASTDISNSWNK